ncbi:DNA polymerase III subunit delta [Sediminicoccus rosea]|jgi:DNA polymerase-3 subunit delta|uniref:DNA-directed DNA polymerase n=1 Tax=Sediminicoccus rosea TaxID=1225128 RepID=A0ABZ0PKI1_9PROT|nr:DNA polymerase III subunit delta [Sediminicoccus rosea]WPB86249.1 DNA polymerase III subunit delta [Sediminicoccus rosea]
MVAKLEPRRLPGFLADPPAECRVVLLIGDDAGLVNERAAMLVRAVAGDDPICIAEPPREAARDPGSLAGEAASVPLMGGRMAIRLRDARDAWAEAVKGALAGPGPGLVIIEGAGLTGKSKLKALVAADPRGQVIECYAERGRDLAASITRILSELGAAAEPAALDWLTERAGEDRMAMRRALEVLALHAEPGSRITVEDAMELLGEGSMLDLDEALMAASLGEVAAADRAIAKAFGEGANPVQVLRAALRHTQRLHMARLAMEGGASADEAVGALRPPVFWKAKPAMTRALSRWSVARLEALGAALLRAERQAKSTGLPDETVARQVVLGLARSAAR